MERPPRLGRIDLARGAHQQRRSDLLFKLRNLLTDDCLADAEPLSRARERSGIHDSGEIGKTIEVHFGDPSARIVSP
jgi:hypothetical protein